MRSVYGAMALLLGTASAAVAQEPGQAIGIEEVVVTAQRREENLQQVPIAVTALSAAKLENAVISRTEDLTYVTPGLQMARFRQSASPFIRGVGNPDTSPGNEASNATYVDGVYVSSMGAGFFAFNNIERIEVLKGPQGTLFGRNATGGLVQVVTKDPSHEPQFVGQVGYGNYETVNTSLYGSAGLSDQLAADVAVYYRDQGKGFGVNHFTGNEVYRGEELALRTKWKLDLGDTEVTAAVDYGRSKGSDGFVRMAPPGAISRGAVAGSVSFRGEIYDANATLDPYNDIEQYGAMLKVSHDLGWAQVVSLSGARKTDAFWVLDQDVVPEALQHADITERSASLSQELQLVSPKESAIDWIAGAFYLRSQGSYEPLAVTGALLAPFGGFQTVHSKQTTESVAAYGQATVEVLPDTKLTVGGRYTTDRKWINASVRTGVSNTLVPEARAKWSKFTWRVVLDHQFNDATMVYASANRGFKAGNFNTVTPTSPAVRPETLDAFEVGSKADLLGRRLRLNTAAFLYKYKDIQLNIISGPGRTQLINAAKSTMKGFEVELEAAPTDALTVRAAAAYLDAKYDDFPNAPSFQPSPLATGGNATLAIPNARGYHMVRSPKWTLNGSADYRVPVAYGDVTASVSYYYNAGVYWAVDNRIKQPSFQVVNAQVAWTAADKRYGLKLWAKNLFDEKYYLDLTEEGLGDKASAAPPRTYGVEATWRF